MLPGACCHGATVTPDAASPHQAQAAAMANLNQTIGKQKDRIAIMETELMAHSHAQTRASGSSLSPERQVEALNHQLSQMAMQAPDPSCASPHTASNIAPRSRTRRR